MRPSYHVTAAAVVAVLLILQTPTYAATKVELSPVSTVYLPSGEQNVLQFGAAPIGKIAYSGRNKLIYGAGKNMLHVINVAEASRPKIELSRFEPDMEFSAIAECGGLVFVTVRNMADRGRGELRVYSGFPQGFQLLAQKEVGANPSDVIVREGCKAAVITLAGDPFTDSDGNVQDPEGEVLIASFPDGVTDKNSIKIKRIGFGQFNDNYKEFVSLGVRFVSKQFGINSTFSQDMEPENVVVDEFEETLYVTLQENNAIAVIDLWTEEVTKIMGLGSKRWGHLDASDKDGGPLIAYWPIRAWYQPSAIQFYEWNWMKLLIVANEGKPRDYEQTRDISQNDLSPSVKDIIKRSIDDDSKLGRLKMSVMDGKNPKTNKYSQLYTFGGRSFTIWTVAGGPFMRLFDSEAQLEEKTADKCPHMFNRDVRPDDRSDDMGPEPNAITVGELEGHLYIFIGTKHPGTIFVYKVGANLRKPQFETIYCRGIPDDENRSYQEMYQDKEFYAAGIKDMKFVPAKQSPTGNPVLMVTGEKSGTITLLDINLDILHKRDASGPPSESST